MKVESIESDVERIDELRAAAQDQGRSVPQWIQQLDEDLADAKDSQATWQYWHRLAFGVKTALPKTSETIALLERWMISLAELPEQEDENEPPAAGALLSAPSHRVDPEEAQRRMIEIVRDRSVWWVLGTSLAFEAVILLLAGWRFKRRDF
jgi:hypothetical protein